MVAAAGETATGNHAFARIRLRKIAERKNEIRRKARGRPPWDRAASAAAGAQRPLPERGADAGAPAGRAPGGWASGGEFAELREGGLPENIPMSVCWRFDKG